MTETAEEWRPVPGYVDHYEVSSLGRVRCVKPNRDRILKPNPLSKGNNVVSLSYDGLAKTFAVARLVCLAFHGPANGRQAFHVSTDTTDDSADNVRWSV